MSIYGNPACDLLMLSDERNYAAMEAGSVRLLHAIEDYYTAKAKRVPMRPVGGDLIWRHAYWPAVTVRDAANDTTPPRVDRSLCKRCGARKDRHAESGCRGFK